MPILLGARDFAASTLTQLGEIDEIPAVLLYRRVPQIGQSFSTGFLDDYGKKEGVGEIADPRTAIECRNCA